MVLNLLSTRSETKIGVLFVVKVESDVCRLLNRARHIDCLSAPSTGNASNRDYRAGYDKVYDAVDD